MTFDLRFDGSEPKPAAGKIGRPGEGWPPKAPCGRKACSDGKDPCDLPGCWRRPEGYRAKPAPGKERKAKPFPQIVEIAAAAALVFGIFALVFALLFGSLPVDLR